MNGAVTLLRGRPEALALAAMIVVVATLPAEVHGDGAAGVAGLVAAAALASCRDVAPRRAAWFALAALVAVPLARAAAAPGSAVRPLAIVLVGAAAGIVAAGLPEAVRSHRFWPGLIAAAGAVVGARAAWEGAFGLDAMRAAAASATALVDRDLVLGRIAEGRAYGGFPTPAALGGFLALALAITAGAAAARSGRTRRLLVAAAVLQGAGLVASRSLTAAGALVVAVGLFALRAGLSAEARRRLLLAAGCAVLVLAVTVSLRGRGAIDATLGDSPWALRSGNVRAAAAMAADHPWLGVGPGGYGETFPQYRTLTDNTTRHAHSLPFELCAEAGVPLGLLLTLVFFGTFLGPVLRRSQGAAEAGAAIGLAAFAVQNLGDFTALLPSTLAAAAVVRGLEAREGSPRGRCASAVPGAAFAAAAPIACALFALDALGADARREARAAFAAGEGERALAAANRAIAYAPWDPDARLYRAQIVEAADRPASLNEIERALTLAPQRPAALAARARLRVPLGDIGGALGDLERAARLYPADPEYARARDDLARSVAAVLP